jgi:hypothetical protein
MHNSGMSEPNKTSFSTENQPTKKTKQKRDVDQEIALLEKKLAQKRESKRANENGEKYVIGGMMLALAETDPSSRKRLLELAQKHVTRPADVNRIAARLARWKAEFEAVQAPDGAK